MFDDLPKPKKDVFTPRDLTDLSISEIIEYIDDLQNEIIRAQNNMKKKTASQNAAESFFKS